MGFFHEGQRARSELLVDRFHAFHGERAGILAAFFAPRAKTRVGRSRIDGWRRDAPRNTPRRPNLSLNWGFFGDLPPSTTTQPRSPTVYQALTTKLPTSVTVDSGGCSPPQANIRLRLQQMQRP
jgi:hypothetical protein